MDRLLIITWVSASGKTTLKDELVDRWWKSALNFTTRQPRMDKELDDYVFIDKETFFWKLEQWHFIEHTEFNWEHYAVSAFLPKGNVVTVLDPVGRNQIMEKFSRDWEEVNTVYIDIPPIVQKDRLEERRVSNLELRQRQADYNWFDRTKFCLELDGTLEVDKLADYVELKYL